MVADLRSGSVQQLSFWTLEAPSHNTRDLFTDIDLHPTPLQLDRRAVGARGQQISQYEDCRPGGDEKASRWICPAGRCCACLADSRRHHTEDHCIISLFDGPFGRISVSRANRGRWQAEVNADNTGSCQMGRQPNWCRRQSTTCSSVGLPSARISPGKTCRRTSAPIAAVRVGRRPARLAWDTIVQVRGRYGITNAAVVGPRSPPNRPRPLLTYYF
jgi:hypothetical protein